eukprot:1196084-Prorocentrum_minimum.AAC.8
MIGGGSNGPELPSVDYMAGQQSTPWLVTYCPPVFRGVQWFEMATEPVPRISRPRQIYAGAPNRDFVALERRPSAMRAKL